MGRAFEVHKCACAVSVRNTCKKYLWYVHGALFFVTVFLVGLSLTVDSSMEKRVLVSVGENTRVVPFSTPPASDSAAVGVYEALAWAIRESFKDIQRMDQGFFLQIKNDEWGGVFVDMQDGQEIADRSVVRAVLKPGTEVICVALWHSTYNVSIYFYFGRFLLSNNRMLCTQCPMISH